MLLSGICGLHLAGTFALLAEPMPEIRLKGLVEEGWRGSGGLGLGWGTVAHVF